MNECLAIRAFTALTNRFHFTFSFATVAFFCFGVIIIVFAESNVCSIFLRNPYAVFMAKNFTIFCFAVCANRFAFTGCRAACAFYSNSICFTFANTVNCICTHFSMCAITVRSPCAISMTYSTAFIGNCVGYFTTIAFSGFSTIVFTCSIAVGNIINKAMSESGAAGRLTHNACLRNQARCILPNMSMNLRVRIVNVDFFGFTFYNVVGFATGVTIFIIEVTGVNRSTYFSFTIVSFFSNKIEFKQFTGHSVNFSIGIKDICCITNNYNKLTFSRLCFNDFNFVVFNKFFMANVFKRFRIECYINFIVLNTAIL